MRNLIAVVCLVGFILVGIRIRISLLEETVIPSGQKIAPPVVEITEPQPKGVDNQPAVSASGLVITTMVAGEGPMARRGDLVTIRYRGLLASGEEFDQNLGAPGGFQFVLGMGQLITGLDQALIGQTARSYLQIDVPWELAYGEEGIESVIPPKANLRFEIRIESIQPGAVLEKLPDVTGLKKRAIRGLECYEKRVESSGKVPVKGQRVSVHFTGWLPDGSVFDSSIARQIPFQFRVGGRVIEGFNRAVQAMRPTEQLICLFPPEMGYGSQTVPGIPADSTLIFSLELLEILNLSR